jgi:aryl-alcohol dehydrogenase-like predicted oxidoreductase
MEFRQLGRSGLKVPVLSFGTGTFGGGNEFFKAWGASDVAEATRLVDICLEAGVNLFDTADIYSDGLSETILGKAVAGRRDQASDLDQSHFPHGPGPNDLGSSRHHLIQACEASLRRLGTDYIDIYHLHGFDALTRRSGGSSQHPRQPGEERQGALHRVLEFFRLASDEVARRV